MCTYLFLDRLLNRFLWFRGIILPASVSFNSNLPAIPQMNLLSDAYVWTVSHRKLCTHKWAAVFEATMQVTTAPCLMIFNRSVTDNTIAPTIVSHSTQQDFWFVCSRPIFVLTPHWGKSHLTYIWVAILDVMCIHCACMWACVSYKLIIIACNVEIVTCSYFVFKYIFFSLSRQNDDVGCLWHSTSHAARPDTAESKWHVHKVHCVLLK